MSDVVREMFRRVLSRQPTTADYHRVSEFLDQLPEEIVASPAAIADIVVRVDHIRQMEEVVVKAAELVKRAGWETQQRIHSDLPHRIDRAAAEALNRIRDKLPIDAADRVSRLLKWGAAWTVVVFFVAATAGWMLADYVHKNEAMTQQAYAERAFNTCIDAAEGAAASTVGGGGNPVRYDGALYRTRARSCAAEYADRRAMAS